MSLTLIAALATLLLSPPAPAPAAAPAMPPNMEAHQVVFLVKGPRRDHADEDAARIQKEHLAHLGAMAEAGKLVLAGPVGGPTDPDLRGICIYRTATMAEARALAEADPAVKAGRLAVESATWWVERGYVAFPKAPVVEDAEAGGEVIPGTR